MHYYGKKTQYVIDGRSQDAVTGLHGKIEEKRIELKLSPIHRSTHLEPRKF
jgi:hypothetical protein